jgi:hypothetical protein
MRTRIVLMCAVLCVASITSSAVQSQDNLYSAIRANDLRQIKTLLAVQLSTRKDPTELRR